MKLKNFLASLAIALPLSVATAQADTNIRVGAIGLVAGVIDVTADFNVGDSWTLGPSIQYLNRSIGDFEASAFGLGVRGNYYFGRSAFTQGWYLGPSLSYMNVEVEDKDSGANATGSGLTISAIGGYQWMWDSFNINLGLGPVYYAMGEVEVEDSFGEKQSFDSYNGLGLALELTLGWKF